MKSERIIITIKDNIDPEIALNHVATVIKQGKVSKVKDKTQYCFHSVFTDNISVTARYKYNINADSFIVHREQNTGIKKWEKE